MKIGQPGSSATRPAVSAVIPAYRAVDRIGSAIGSFLGQSGVDPSVVVVVDDGCMRTAEVAQSFGPRVRVVVNPTNKGASASRNIGLSFVRDPHVLFLDSDDWVEGELVSSLVGKSLEDECDICFGHYVVEVEHSRRRIERRKISRERDEIFADWLVGTAYVPPVAVMWRTEYVRSIGGWCEEISRNDDTELVLRALLKGCRFGFAEDGLGVYLWHQSPDRVSKQVSRVGDMLTVVRKMLAHPDGPVPRPVIMRAAGEAAYEIARTAYEEGERPLAIEALALARSSGLLGHRGRPSARLISALFGLESRVKLMLLANRMRTRTSASS